MKRIRAPLGLAAASLASSAVYLLRSRRLLGPGLPLDDAWIHQTYARSLAERGEWAFQPGEASAGSTSPLWSGLLAVGRWLAIDHLVWTYLLGALLLALTAWGVVRWIRLRQPGSRWTAAAGAMVILEWHLVWAGVSGMEILAFGLLALVTLYESERRRLGPFWLGGLIGLAIWLRPEAVLLILPVGWNIAWRAGRDIRAALRTAAAAGLGLLLPVAGYALFNWTLSGHWLPNTWYAKAAEYAVLRQIPLLTRLAGQMGIPGEVMGHPELASGGPIVGPLILLLPGIGLAIRGCLRRDGAVGLAPVMWVVAHLSAYALRLPATYQHGRYAMPVIPVLLAMGADGLIGWCSVPSRQAVRSAVARAWPISLALVTVFFWWIGGGAYVQDVAVIESEMVAAARWVAGNTPPPALVAAHDIGALGYYGQRRILDLAGLVSPEVIPILRDEQALADLLDRRRADYLISFPGWYPRLTLGLPALYTTQGRFSPAAGGENMVVYRWPSPTVGP